MASVGDQDDNSSVFAEMPLTVKRIVAGLALVNILALAYFLFISSNPQTYNFPSEKTKKLPYHSKTFLKDESVTVKNDEDQSVTTLNKIESNSDATLANIQADLLEPDQDYDYSSSLPNRSDIKAGNLQYNLDEPYEGLINPFRVLGFYNNPSPDIYYGKLYHKRKKFFETSFLYGLKKNGNYCDHSDLYNIFNPNNVFSHKHFFTEYIKSEVLRRLVIENIGVDLFPNISLDMTGFFEPIYDLDLRTNIFFTKHSDFHYTHKIGSEFLCKKADDIILKVLIILKGAGQIYNHIPGGAVITRKDFLVGTVNSYADYYSSKPSCFNKSMLLPTSYRFANETECRAFFSEIQQEAYHQKKKEAPLQYIIKRSATHKAAGVFLFTERTEKIFLTKYSNGEKCGRISYSLIAQKYIPNPLLLDKNNKFDFRMYMLIASVDPIILYYHDGFLRVSLKEYSGNSTDRLAHLTNTHLSKQMFDTIEGNETLEEELRDYQMWTLEELQEQLLKTGKITDPNWLDNYLRPKFKTAYIHLVRMSRGDLWKHSSVFEMYGLDFILDDDLNLWLLECNTSPQLDGTSPAKEELLVRLLSDMFEIQFAYLRSKMKRLLTIIHDFQSKLISKKLFDLKAEREKFDKANKNYLDPEYRISDNNTWVKILDENIRGKEAYMGHLADECIIDL